MPRILPKTIHFPLKPTHPLPPPLIRLLPNHVAMIISSLPIQTRLDVDTFPTLLLRSPRIPGRMATLASITVLARLRLHSEGDVDFVLVGWVADGDGEGTAMRGIVGGDRV